MLKHQDLVDLILFHLKGKKGEQPARETRKDEPRGRPFLTEHEVKRRLTENPEHLRIPKDAILSPLVMDWLVLKGVKVTRE